MIKSTYKLMVCIAPQNEGEKLCAVANENGAAGGTLLLGRGTAHNSILQLLGIGDTSKDIAQIIVKSDAFATVAEAIKAAEATQRSHYGVLLSMDVIDFYRAGDDMSSFIEKDSTMDNNNLGGELIQVIVNKGYADDAMAAARKAGAFGGTVINARGTAKPDDKKFFGMQIVPEKEILLIVVPKDKATEVYNAICSISCLSEKGSGIVFRLPVCGYELLGK